MEELKGFFYQTLETARFALPKRFFSRWVLPSLTALLLAYGAPFEEMLFGGSGAPVFPLAAFAFCCAAWCSIGKQSFFTSLLGLFAGSAASGAYSGCFAAALMLLFAVLLGIIRQKAGVMAIMKYASLLAVSLALLPLCAVFGLWKTPGVSGFLEHICLCALTTALAFLLEQGIRTAVRSAQVEVGAGFEISLLSLALLLGLICAAFSYMRLFGLGLGVAAAALFCLVLARSCGLSAIACAAVIASSRVFALNADMLFIAVLCLCTLSAVLLRPLGKWGVLAGFAGASLALFTMIHGTGTVSPGELLLCCCIFALTDVKIGVSSEKMPRTEREAALERELFSRNARLTMLSKVLFEMARMADGAECGEGGFINAQLSGVAKSLALMASASPVKGERYRIGIGSAESPGRVGEQTGDTACIREMDGMSLAAISDGMGMGEAARRESEQTVNMVADLVSCGFDIKEAAELVNRLLLIGDGGEMYATLDVMLFDRENGSLIAAKHGAPASYILRHGKLNALCAEALPVGIVEEAKTAVFSARIKRGDVIIMMSDGVSDALGDALPSALKRTANGKDPGSAARELIESARSMGGADDMTAIVAMVG